MVTAMAQQKKLFPCGHRGKGQVCHRCQQEAVAAKRQAQAVVDRQREKRAWDASFEADVVDLRRLPEPIVIKARRIIDALQRGTDYRYFKGKQMRADSSLIRVPVSHDYRLILKRSGHELIMVEVLSHEDYNKKYGKNQRRIG